ncbi:MAG: secretin N-terminal domain-containing protein [Opitutales bacterium]
MQVPIPLSLPAIRLHVLAAAFLSLTLSTSLVAQPDPGATPGATNGIEESDPDERVGPFILRDESAPQVLSLLEKLTGKVILRPQNLQPQKINFDSLGPLPRTDAVSALKSLLSMNGLAVVPLNDRFWKAVQINTVVNSLTPEVIGDASEAGPASQEIYSKIFRLDYLTTEQALEILPPFLTPNLAEPVAFKKSNSILVTDSLSVLQRLEQILARVDQPTDYPEQLIFLPLEHTSAPELQQRIRNLAEGSLKNYLSGNAVIEADERTNQLIVFTHPSNEALLRQLVDKLDIDVDPLTRNEVFYIRHAKATEVAALIEQIITGQKSVRSETEGRTTATTAGRRNADETQGPQPARQTTQVSLPGNEIGGTPNLQFSDFVGIVADERSNAIVAYGTASDIAYISDLIDRIDVLLAQVRIEVIIAEVTLSRDQARGIDAFGVNYSDTAEVEFTVDGASTSRLEQSFNLGGTLRDFSLDAVINTAKRDNNVRVLSAPTIVTTHNKEAIIKVGERRPVITSSQTDTTNTATRSQIQLRDIGIELKVNPLIGNNGVIQLEIEQKVENVIDTVSIDGNQQPVIGNREATSFVSVADQELVVLGGLQEISESDGRGRLFFFGDIPVVGDLLFGSRTRELQRRELLIFIKPIVMQGTTAANRQGQKEIDDSPLREQIDDHLSGERLKTLNPKPVETSDDGPATRPPQFR